MYHTNLYRIINLSNIFAFFPSRIATASTVVDARFVAAILVDLCNYSVMKRVIVNVRIIRLERGVMHVRLATMDCRCNSVKVRRGY